MKEMFEAYMRYGDLASEMISSSSDVSKSTLSEADLTELIARYEWFSVAHILKARLSGQLDYQTKLLLATGRCPFTLVRPMADVVTKPREVATMVHNLRGSGEILSQVAHLLGLDPKVENNNATTLPQETQQESLQDQDSTASSSTLNVIDNFLSLDGDQLKIRPDDKTTSEDISLNSIVAELDIVSEELAQIYLEQGYKNTAIEIYNKLSLLNPEKSVYFAELIEEIK